MTKPNSKKSKSSRHTKKSAKPKILDKQTKKESKDTVLPNGVSEAEFLRVLDNISRRLGHKFRFGYHDFDDMKQQACIFAMEGLEKYDNSRPLENFLWTHVRNRLFNYKRNNYQRPDKPCHTCPFFDKSYKCSNNQCSKYSEKKDCDLYLAWSNRNEAKKNIMQPTYIENDNYHSSECDFVGVLGNNEIIKFLDANIQKDYRENYLKLKHGIKIPKAQLTKLVSHIKNIMESKGWDPYKKNEDN